VRAGSVGASGTGQAGSAVSTMGGTSQTGSTVSTVRGASQTSSTVGTVSGARVGRSASSAGSSTKVARTITVAIDTGVDLVQQVAVVWAGSVGASGASQASSAVGAVGAVRGASQTGSTVRDASASVSGAAISRCTSRASGSSKVVGAITVGVDTRVGLVEEIAVVWASGIVSTSGTTKTGAS